MHGRFVCVSVIIDRFSGDRVAARTGRDLPEAVYEALRQVAFDERRKIHDLLMEGVELALKKRGYAATYKVIEVWSVYKR